jgi:diguanylate cyclase (GGDEF)-like protein
MDENDGSLIAERMTLPAEDPESSPDPAPENAPNGTPAPASEAGRAADQTLRRPTIVLDSIDDLVFLADGEAALNHRHGKTVSQTVEELVSTSEESAKACFIVMRGQQAGRMYELGAGVAYVGRGDDATISIDDSAVSRRHAAIHSSPVGFVVSDLKSTNGLFVNGKRVERHVLRDGDRVQFGSATVLKFCYQDELEQNLQQRLYDSATRDQLVGVHNRQFFLDQLQAAFSHATRRNAPLSVLMLDLDHFKAVNDTYGHLAGDHVLKEVARLIKEAIRAEDVFARFGGEEFVLLLLDSGVDASRQVAERIRGTVAEHAFEYEDRPIRSTLSIGLATYQARNHASPRSLLAAADAALYEAKRAGRNCTVWSQGASKPTSA